MKMWILALFGLCGAETFLATKGANKSSQSNTAVQKKGRMVLNHKTGKKQWLPYGQYLDSNGNVQTASLNKGVANPKKATTQTNPAAQS